MNKYIPPLNENTEFLQNLVKDAKWFPEQDLKVNMIYRSENRIPVPVQMEQMQAEQLAGTLKEVFSDLYDRLEVLVMELNLPGTIRFSDNWKHAAEKMALLVLNVCTSEHYKVYLNEKYPPAEEGFGKNIIQIYASAAITEPHDGFYLVTFVGWANTGLQYPDDKLKYAVGVHLETIY